MMRPNFDPAPANKMYEPADSGTASIILKQNPLNEDVAGYNEHQASAPCYPWG